MVKFSYGDDSHHPAVQSVELIHLAEELGFYAAYQADAPSMRDSWLVAAAAARETSFIRLGFSAAPLFIREPTLTAQALATLDGLSNGRAECAVSFGDFSLLEAYRIEPAGGSRLAKLREAFEVMRAYLDEGDVTHEGTFYRYAGLTAAVRPVQQHVPLLIGTMGGPRALELAGEISDGAHYVGTSAGESEFVIEHVRRGAERAERDWRNLDIAAVCITAVDEDRAAAKEAARTMLVNWLPGYSPKLIERHGVEYDAVLPFKGAAARGELEEAARLITPEMLDAMTISGTPEECIEKIQVDLVDAGIEHIVLTPAVPSDPDFRRPPGTAGLLTAEQLRLLADQVMPAFS